ncbi:ganglioside-induced differentiation-associated protein 1-like [Glandiceps talaboti]
MEPWFLRLNPIGKIPIIVHGENIVSETPRILEYLDEAFPGESRLNPLGEEGERVKYFRDFADAIFIGDLMAGIYRHPHLVPGTKSGVFPSWRIPQIVKLVHEDIPRKAVELAEKHPDLKDNYLRKIQEKKDEYWGTPTEKYFKTVLSKIDQLLSEVEIQLQETKRRIPNVLINRMKHYGIGEMFWADGKRPLVASYLEWMMSRESCKQALPSFKPETQK